MDGRPLAHPLRLAIVEIMDHAATDEDWHAVCAQLVANACDALELAGTEPPAEQTDSLREWITQVPQTRTAERFVLSDEEWVAFNEALNRPPAPNPALVELFRRRRPR